MTESTTGRIAQTIRRVTTFAGEHRRTAEVTNSKTGETVTIKELTVRTTRGESNATRVIRSCVGERKFVAPCPIQGVQLGVGIEQLQLGGIKGNQRNSEEK